MPKPRVSLLAEARIALLAEAWIRLLTHRRLTKSSFPNRDIDVWGSRSEIAGHSPAESELA